MKPEEMTPEQRSRAEAILARWHTPESRAAEVRDREELADEYRRTGTIESDDLAPATGPELTPKQKGI